MVIAPLNSSVLARLDRALSFWQAKGFVFVNLPWLASDRFVKMTKPAFVTTEDPSTLHGGLVASGEQSFLEMWEEGALAAGQRYIGWTPCFREEPTFDETHHFYFLKAELFCPVAEDNQAALQQMLEGSKALFEKLAGQPLATQVVPISEDQLDLELSDIEVGSYGVRELPSGGSYVYGTALAEPRFSTALKRHLKG